MIHSAKRRLGMRTLVLVPALAFFGVVPASGSSAQVQADGPDEVVRGGGHVLTSLASIVVPAKPATRTHGKITRTKGKVTRARAQVTRTRGKVTVDINRPDTPILPGRVYRWPFTITNRSASTIEKVTFSTRLSKHLEFVPGQDDCAWRQQMAICRLGAVEHGETRTGTLSAKVAHDVSAGATISGGATVTWDQSTAAQRIETEFPKVTVAPCTDLAVTGKAPENVQPGGVLPYEITVLNKGLETAEDVVLRQLIRAVLPDTAGQVPIKVADVDSSCAPRQSRVVCDLGSLEAGESRQIRLNVQVSAALDVGTLIKAPAQVTSPTIDLHQADNDCAPETEVLPVPPVHAAVPVEGPRGHVAPDRPAGPAPEGPRGQIAPRAATAPMGLPRTGAPTELLVGVACTLLAAGLLLTVLGRRRRVSRSGRL